MPRVRVILQLGKASGCRIHMSYWWLHISSPLVSATLSCACSLPGVLLPQVLLLSSRQVVWVAAEEILCCGLAQLAMSCSLLQLHSPTLFPYPSFLSSSMAVDGPTAKAGGGGHQLSSSISHPCTKLYMAAVDCQCGLLQNTRSSLYNFYSFCTVRVKLLFFIPLVVKNENDLLCIALHCLSFLYSVGHILWGTLKFAVPLWWTCSSNYLTVSIPVSLKIKTPSSI